MSRTTLRHLAVGARHVGEVAGLGVGGANGACSGFENCGGGDETPTRSAASGEAVRSQRLVPIARPRLRDPYANRGHAGRQRHVCPMIRSWPHGPGDSHPRPAHQGLRQLHAQGTRAGARSRARRRSSSFGWLRSCSSWVRGPIHPVTCTGHTSRRATCSSASTARATGGSRRARSCPGSRTNTVCRRACRVSSTSRSRRPSAKSAVGAARPHPQRRPQLIEDLLDTRGTRTTRRATISPRSWRSGSTAARAGRRASARRAAPPRSRRRTRRSSDAGANVPRCAAARPAGRAPRDARRTWRDRQVASRRSRSRRMPQPPVAMSRSLSSRRCRRPAAPSS